MGKFFEQMGDQIDPGNKLVMDVNNLILDCFGDTSFEVLSKRYKEALLQSGVIEDW